MPAESNIKNFDSDGIFWSQGTTVTLDSVTFDNNKVVSGGGALRLAIATQVQVLDALDVGGIINTQGDAVLLEKPSSHLYSDVLLGDLSLLSAKSQNRIQVRGLAHELVWLRRALLRLSICKRIMHVSKSCCLLHL